MLHTMLPSGAVDGVSCACLGSGDVGHGGGEWMAGMEAPRSGDRRPGEHPPDSCTERSLRIYGLAVPIRLPGRSHGHYRATWATAPDTSAEVSPASTITQPGEILSAHRPVRPVRSGLYSAAGARYHPPAVEDP
jgi:hypothetical protein